MLFCFVASQITIKFRHSVLKPSFHLLTCPECCEWAVSAKISGGTAVFEPGLALAEVDEAVARLAMPFRQPKSAAGGLLQQVALEFPHGQALGPFFAAGRTRSRPG
jgi:hypothetical protein